jgi:hypothetical protein
MRRLRLRRIIGLGLSTLLLAACGGSGGSEDEGNPGEDGSAPLDCSIATSTWSGHLVIESEADLAKLDGIRTIEGELQIDKTGLTNLDVLGCIEEVGGELTIFGNAELIDVTGLGALTRVGDSFILSENTALPELVGIDALTQVGGSTIIQGNVAMTGLSGLTSLATIVGAINFRSNDSLEHIDGLGALRTVGSQLAITQNPSLCISSVNRVGEGITDPSEIPDNWSTRSNDESC